MSIQGIMKKSDVDTAIVDIDAQIEDFFTNKKDKCQLLWQSLLLKEL